MAAGSPLSRVKPRRRCTDAAPAPREPLGAGGGVLLRKPESALWRLAGEKCAITTRNLWFHAAQRSEFSSKNRGGYILDGKKEGRWLKRLLASVQLT